jgi:hypothetical protein
MVRNYIPAGLGIAHPDDTAIKATPFGNEL